MKLRAIIPAALLGAGVLLAPAAASAAPVTCPPAVTVRHLGTITITGLCPAHVRVQLARPIVVVGTGENQTVEHDVIVARTRAHCGVAVFTGIHLGYQYEWRTVRGSHKSGWTIVNV